MPAQNYVDPEWDLDTLILIHGLLDTDDTEYAIEGIALDLGLSVLETRALLRAHGVDIDRLDKR